MLFSMSRLVMLFSLSIFINGYTQRSKDFQLFRSAFMATVGAVCDMYINKMCLTLINYEVFNHLLQSTLKRKEETFYIGFGDAVGFMEPIGTNTDMEDAKYEVRRSTFPHHRSTPVGCLSK